MIKLNKQTKKLFLCMRKTIELATNHHPSSTVRKHTPTTHFHTLILYHSGKAADISYTYSRISLPHRFSTPISWQKEGMPFASPVIQTGASAVGGRRHNRHATTCNSVYNSTAFLWPIPNPGLRSHPSTRWGQGRHV